MECIICILIALFKPSYFSIGIRYIDIVDLIYQFIWIRNIFLKQNGDIKLGDFGISRSFEESTSLVSTVIGTRDYMSPRMRSGLKYSFETDCWFVTFYHIVKTSCTSRHVFRAFSYLAVLKQTIIFWN